MATFPPGYPTKPDSRGRARKKFQGRAYDFGEWGTPSSIAAYQQWLAEHVNETTEKPERATVAVMLQKWAAFEADERGLRHREVIHMRRAVAPLDSLYGHSWCDEFRLPQLRAVQKAMLAGTWQSDAHKAELAKQRKPLDWSAEYANKQVKRILRVFRWAEESGYVPEGRWHHLSAITSIHATDARYRHAPEREPVDWATQVEPILPRLSPQIAAIVQTQYLTGARPGEILAMRRGEIDRDGPDGCWLFTPGTHKGAWRGHGRVIVIGPRGQAILAPFLLQCPDDDAFVFRSSRRKPKPYSSEAYCKAVRLACEDAGIAKFTPYDLRHLASRRVRRAFGPEGVKLHLGHVSADTGKHYGKGLTEADIAEAAKIARAVG